MDHERWWAKISFKVSIVKEINCSGAIPALFPDEKIAADPELNVNKPQLEDTTDYSVPPMDLIAKVSQFVFLFFILLFLQVLAFMFVFDDEDEILFFEFFTSSQILHRWYQKQIFSLYQMTCALVYHIEGL